MLTCEPASAAANLLTCAKQMGAEFVFTNLGSDHPAFIQAFSELDAGQTIPEIVSCPHEMTALSAAHGYAMITRRPQLVLVHVDVGTQNLGCSIHNAARGRVPVIIVAGLSPVTLYGPRAGTRTEFIHYLQEVPSQTEIVRQYMKWTHELRAPETVHHIMLRGRQMACAEPQGPVYITGGREFWEEESRPDRIPLTPAARLGGLAPDAEDEIFQLLLKARRPLLITSYLGRNTQAVERLMRLSDITGLAVQEVAGQYMNFPADHPNHVGYRRDSLVDEADLILAVDTDVPWLPNNVRPSENATAIGIDCDPQKDRFGLWSYPLHGVYQADSNVVLEQLLARAQAHGAISGDVLAARRGWARSIKESDADTTPPADGAITPGLLSEAVARMVDDNTIVLVESPSSTNLIPRKLGMTRPGSFYASGGSGLGWAINAAIGAKLASPQSTVISLVGDGCYLFGVPSSAYWVARSYNTPTLTIIFNNRGWHAPKISNDLVHDEGGLAGSRDSYWITIGAGGKLADVAKAMGGAEAFEVDDADMLEPVLQQALAVVRAGQSAVVDVRLEPISQQTLGRRQ